MSYSFNWDCTLPIENIHDIVSINIVPETKAYNEGDYLSIRGHILIEGEYVSSAGNQSEFNESIPLDITLPNTGRNGDIKVDVTNFDYDVKDDEKLCLELNLSIAGYDLDSVPTLVEEEVEAPVEQAPVLFTKEAAISHPVVQEKVEEEVEKNHHEEDHHSAFIDTDDVDYLDFDDVAMPSSQEAVELVDEDDDDDRKEKLTDKIKQLITQKPVATPQSVVEEVVVEEQPAVEEVVVETQPVVEEVVVETQPVVEEVVVEEQPVVEEVKPVVKPKPVMPIPVIQVVTKPEVEEVVEEIEPEVEEVIVETQPVVEEIKPIAKPKPVMPIPVVQTVLEPEVEEVVEEPIFEPEVEEVVEEVVEEPVFEAVVEEEEEILPFPLKNQSQVVYSQPKTADKSDIFDMLYEFDQEEPEVVIEEEPTPVTIVESVLEPQPVVVEETVTTTPTVEPIVEETKTVTVTPAPTLYDDSIASQFADGESIIKIVFVQEEETTLTDICTKYSVKEENIYDCNNLTFPLCQGDRVMINYGPHRGR